MSYGHAHDVAAVAARKEMERQISLDKETQENPEALVNPIGMEPPLEGRWEDEVTTATQETTKTFTVDELVVSVKQGVNNGKTWTRYGALLEGDDDTAVWGGTFDAGTGGQLQTLKGKAAQITAEKDGNFWNITSVEPAETTTTATTATGTTQGDLTGFRKTVAQQLAAIYSSDATMTAILTANDEERGKIGSKIDAIAKHNAIVVFTTEMPDPTTTEENIPF